MWNSIAGSYISGSKCIFSLTLSLPSDVHYDLLLETVKFVDLLDYRCIASEEFRAFNPALIRKRAGNKGGVKFKKLSKTLKISVLRSKSAENKGVVKYKKLSKCLALRGKNIFLYIFSST